MTFDRQAVFEQVATHLLTQKQCAHEPLPEGGRRFRLRTAEGLKCAIGCLIETEHYSPGLENNPIHYDDDGGHAVRAAVAASLGVDVEELDVEFLRNLQQIHDKIAPAKWYISLGVLARRYGLKPADISNYRVI